MHTPIPKVIHAYTLKHTLLKILSLFLRTFIISDALADGFYIRYRKSKGIIKSETIWASNEFVTANLL